MDVTVLDVEKMDDTKADAKELKDAFDLAEIYFVDKQTKSEFCVGDKDLHFCCLVNGKGKIIWTGTVENDDQRDDFHRMLILIDQ